MFFICRVVSKVLYKLHVFENGPWGSDYDAIWLYNKINPEKAKELADRMFPVVD